MKLPLGGRGSRSMVTPIMGPAFVWMISQWYGPWFGILLKVLIRLDTTQKRISLYGDEICRWNDFHSLKAIQLFYLEITWNWLLLYELSLVVHSFSPLSWV